MPPQVNESEAYADALVRARKAWMHEMREFMGPFNTIKMPPTASIRGDRLSSCKVIESRRDLLARYPKGGRVVEVGVQEGLFSLEIVEILQPSVLYLVDLSFELFRQIPQSTLDSGNSVLEFLEGDSKVELLKLQRDSIDIAYVDADHSYEGVSEDLRNLHDKLKENGRIIVNDYTYWSPLECLPYGVVDAVNEFAKRSNWEFEFIALEKRMYLDVALRKCR